MKIRKGDLVTVHYDHAIEGRESEAGIVVNYKDDPRARTELWLHPGELAGGAAALVEVVFGCGFQSAVRRANYREKATLFDEHGQFHGDGFKSKRVASRVSDANGPNLVVKNVSRNPTVIYADAVANGDRTTYVH